MRVVKDDTGKVFIVMENKEEYRINTQRCAKCEHSFRCEDDYTYYCHWREDYYCIGDWAECSGYQERDG